jgi:hypothetical protein
MLKLRRLESKKLLKEQRKRKKQQDLEQRKLGEFKRGSIVNRQFSGTRGSRKKNVLAFSTHDFGW